MTKTPKTPNRQKPSSPPKTFRNKNPKNSRPKNPKPNAPKIFQIIWLDHFPNFPQFSIYPTLLKNIKINTPWLKY
jgi:hypothetical protein